MKKAEKIFFVDNLSKDIASANSLVLVNYAGLSVKAEQELKSKLKEADAKMVVVKNTLLKRAGEIAKIDSQVLSDTVLAGQTALIISEADPIAPLSILGKFAKEHEVPKFKVGIIDGTFQDTDALIKLSTLPGKDALLAQLLGVLMGPEYGLVGTLNTNMQKLVYMLNLKSQSSNVKSES